MAQMTGRRVLVQEPALLGRFLLANSVLSGLENAYGGLYFGAGSTLPTGAFFAGLIDDVRIYNRVVSP